MKHEVTDRGLTAAEVATYVVCPQAWKLKRTEGTTRKSQLKRGDSFKIRGEWLAEQSTSAQLRKYAKLAYLLLVAVVIAIFLLDQTKAFKIKRKAGPAPIETGATK